jgi:hypothetical protein
VEEAIKAHDTYVEEHNTYVTQLMSDAQAAAVKIGALQRECQQAEGRAATTTTAVEKQVAALSEQVTKLTTELEQAAAEAEKHTQQAGAQGEALREAQAQQASLREELSDLKSSASASTPTTPLAEGSKGLKREVQALKKANRAALQAQQTLRHYLLLYKEKSDEKQAMTDEALKEQSTAINGLAVKLRQSALVLGRHPALLEGSSELRSLLGALTLFGDEVQDLQLDLSAGDREQEI